MSFDKLAELAIKCLNTGESQPIPADVLEGVREEHRAAMNVTFDEVMASMPDFSMCACMGPAGDCPCIRRQRGLPVDIPETHISEELWKLLTDEEKNTVNEIKMRALGRYLFK